jgi:hypothetical protein
MLVGLDGPVPYDFNLPIRGEVLPFRSGAADRRSSFKTLASFSEPKMTRNYFLAAVLITGAKLRARASG